MDDASSWEPVYREPGVIARLFVQTVALASPLLTLFAVLVPGAVFVAAGKDGGAIAIATTGALSYVALLLGCLRGVRRLAARFTPPLTLPGDIWNIGVPEPPRRSRNWPLRLRWVTSWRG